MSPMNHCKFLLFCVMLNSTSISYIGTRILVALDLETNTTKSLVLDK